jgi:hypothetical protein
MDEPKGLDLRSVPPEPDQAPAGKAYLLAIGINRYQHCLHLNNAVKDVRDMIELLTARYQFDAADVAALFDEQATRKTIYQYLNHFTEQIGKHDTLLIYFSGHGQLQKNIDEGFWIPVDGHQDDPGSSIPNGMIMRYLKAIRALHIVVISDACFSGAMFTERHTGAFQRQETVPSRWLFTSGRSEVVSDGPPGTNSPFAAGLLRHLRANDFPRLPITRLATSVIEEVGSNNAQLPRCEHLQNVGHLGGEFMFRLKGVAPQRFGQERVRSVDDGVRTIASSSPRLAFLRPVALVAIALLVIALVYWIWPSARGSVEGSTAGVPNTGQDTLREVPKPAPGEKATVQKTTEPTTDPASGGKSVDPRPNGGSTSTSTKNKPSVSETSAPTAPGNGGQEAKSDPPAPEPCNVTVKTPEAGVRVVIDLEGREVDGITDASGQAVVPAPCDWQGKRVMVWWKDPSTRRHPTLGRYVEFPNK